MDAAVARYLIKIGEAKHRLSLLYDILADIHRAAVKADSQLLDREWMAQLDDARLELSHIEEVLDMPEDPVPKPGFYA